MTRKKKTEGQEKSGQRPTHELWRFVKFYNDHVRAQSPQDCKGVIRQMQRLIDKGIGLDEMAAAVENYANDEWRKAQDPRYSKSIRSFFVAEVIKEWLTPRPKPVRPQDRIAKFTAFQRPAPAAIETANDDPASPDEL